MEDILKGSFVIFMFKVLGAGSLFLTYVLIPRYYGVELFGIFNLIFALMVITAVIARVGLDTYVLRVLSSYENNAHEISLFLKEVFKIVFIGAVIVTFVILFFQETINTYIFKSIDATNYLIGMAIIIVPYTFFNVLPEIFRGFDEIKRYAFFRNFSQNFMVLLLILITIFLEKKYDPIYILYFTVIIITVILSIVLYFFLKEKKITLAIKGRYKNKILKNSYPMFLAASIMFLMSYIDSFMIAYYLDEYQVGIYNACISLSMLITFIPMAIGGFISPKVSLAYSKGNKYEVKKIFKNSLIIIFIVTLPIFGILYVYAEFFLGIFGDAFKLATTTLLLTNIAFLSEALTGPVGFILNMTDNQHIFMKILLISLLINIILNVMLIPIYGINGAAIAILVSMLFWTLGSLVILKRKAIV
jgi:O-antigen/teichoic acid export membrane protein